jgi:hypothetical protein
MIWRKPMSYAFPFGLRKAIAAVALSCCIAGGVSAMTRTSATNSEQFIASTSVNRINKGDRLPQPSALSRFLNDRSRKATISSPPEKPPLGCDPAFSPIVAPGLAHIFNRCLT